MCQYDVYEATMIEKKNYEKIFIQICIYIVWTIYIYEVIMFIKRVFIRR